MNEARVLITFDKVPDDSVIATARQIVATSDDPSQVAVAKALIELIEEVRGLCSQKRIFEKR